MTLFTYAHIWQYMIPRQKGIYVPSQYKLSFYHEYFNSFHFHLNRHLSSLMPLISSIGIPKANNLSIWWISVDSSLPRVPRKKIGVTYYLLLLLLSCLRVHRFYVSCPKLQYFHNPLICTTLDLVFFVSFILLVTSKKLIMIVYDLAYGLCFIQA